jgi:predicted nucleic acid-binding protein
MAAVTRVVLDTNVLVAAAYNPRSASRHVVEACLGGKLTPVLSSALRREY